PHDLGIWDDEHVEFLRRITTFVHTQGAVAGVQLAHAGRKASTRRPWEGRGAVRLAEGGWSDVVAPSAIPFAEDFPEPRALSRTEIDALCDDFRNAAQRAIDAGFRVIELHAAHGYLLHEFLSPLSNIRTDEYGGSLENRARFTLRVVDAIREVWPADKPLLVRVSATDWADGGWNVEECVQLCRWLGEHDADLVDCSSGGIASDVRIPVSPGYQVPFARRIRHEAGIATGAVGMITEAGQAEAVIADGDADMVFMAREFLRQPHWPLLAAHELGATMAWPDQYDRARPR
ncbi:MAG: NADH:flavin oxidoreductase/NADH oxidase, partial [Gemmatimonadaceae bacterium]